jgi:hypothetical protein
MKAFNSIILVICLPIILLAQEENNYKTIALSFNFNGLNLSSYYGGVGGRLWISESTVLNASIGASINETEYEETEQYDKGLTKNKYFDFGIGMENHFIAEDDISLYLSTRLSLGLTDNYYRSHTSDYETTEKSFSYRLGFGLGVEYWLFKRMSLSGQHLFNAYYATGEYHYFNEDAARNTKGYGVSFGTTSLILSIYF